jgi:hypothetical protein
VLTDQDHRPRRDLPGHPHLHERWLLFQRPGQ